MVYALIAASLILILIIGVVALFLAGKSHDSASVEDLKKHDDED